MMTTDKSALPNLQRSQQIPGAPAPVQPAHVAAFQTTATWTDSELLSRAIPFGSLRYSTEAFMDYRIPGCAPKQNYALIGSGVSQSPKQPVSLREKHGFQVGGVMMPAGVINPPHMHFTAEVFICTRSEWTFNWGFNPDHHSARLSPGDICTVPTWIYRGFQNVGTEDGFMFTALGGDDTGGILWAPQTLKAAAENGVHLTDNYQIIDEHLGQQWDSSTMRRLEPMEQSEIDRLRQFSPEEMTQRVVRHADLQWSLDALLDARLPGCGAEMAPVIGHGMGEDRNALAPVNNAHGFSVEWLRIPPGGSMSLHQLAVRQVLTCYQGPVEISVSNTAPTQQTPAQAAIKIIVEGTPVAWDSYAMPADVWRSYANLDDSPALLLVMTPGDSRKAISWSPDVVTAAAEIGLARDANGYVALKKFTDRSQR